MNIYFCIDTDVLIDFQRGNSTALRELAYLERTAPLAISAIVRMELVIGSASREMLQRTEKLLRQFRTLPLTAEVSALADQLITQYSLSNGLRLADALIAATAIEYNFPMLSKNQKDFRFLDKAGLQLLPYPTV